MRWSSVVTSLLAIPKYSIIVSINKIGLPASGGLMAGDVFRQIVDCMIYRHLEIN